MASLAETPGAKRAVELDPERLGNAEPDLVRRPDRGHLGPADAGGERAERAVGRRVRVAAHDDRAGQGEARLGEDLVADAVLDVEEVRDALLGDELADRLVVLGVLLVGGRDDVVEDDDDLLRRGDPGQRRSS